MNPRVYFGVHFSKTRTSPAGLVTKDQFKYAMIFSTLLTCLAVAPAAVWAGMYGQPVINLDAKTFKSVMATEHAAVR
jgi:hypothetical protein